MRRVCWRRKHPHRFIVVVRYCNPFLLTLHAHTASILLSYVAYMWRCQVNERAPDVSAEMVCDCWLCSFYANAWRVQGTPPARQSIASAYVFLFSTSRYCHSVRSVRFGLFCWLFRHSLAICYPEALVHCKHHQLEHPKTNTTNGHNHLQRTQQGQLNLLLRWLMCIVVMAEVIRSRVFAIHCANFSALAKIGSFLSSAQMKNGMGRQLVVMVWGWFNE